MSAQPIPYNGPASTDANGVLNVWVQQPTDNSPAANPNKATYTELWKGPYTKGKDVLKDIHPGDSITAFHNWLGADRVYRISPAEAPYAKDGDGNTHQLKWLVESINVVEAKAGDHCTIRAVFEAAAADDSDTTELIPESEEWTLTWQPYTVSPYEFCSNEPHEPRILSPGGEMNRDWQSTASRDNIEQYRLWAGKATEVQGQGGAYTAYAWNPNPKQTNACYPTRYALTDAEALVWEKVQLGRNAIYHYPVLSYTRDYNCLSGDFDPPDSDGKLGSDLDIGSENMPDGCPFTLDNFVEGDDIKNWSWIKTGDTVQSVGRVGDGGKVYRRTETWMGVSSFDENFYGDTAFNHANENGMTKGRWYKGCL